MTGTREKNRDRSGDGVEPSKRGAATPCRLLRPDGPPGPCRIARGDEVVVLPGQIAARVRSIQVHDQPVPEAEAGQRVALALGGVGWRELRRGDLVCHRAGRPRATYRLDAAVALEQAAGLDEPAARRAWRELEAAGLAVRVDPNRHFDPATLDQLIAAVIEVCRRDGGTTAAQVRDALGTSRRYAQALLEHLDAATGTIRRGDRHVLRRSSDSITAGRAP
jgi:hypothetical protein